MQSISLPKEVLDQINTIFFRFLWKKNFDNKRAYEKVKRNVVCNNYTEGGLKMVDIHRLQDSMLLAWATQLLTNEVDPDWKTVAANWYSKVGGLAVFRSKVLYSKFRGSHHIKSQFWKKVLEKWLDNSNNHTNITVTLDDPIFNNNQLQYVNNTLFLPTSLERGVIQLRDFISNGRIMTQNEFSDQYGRHSRSILDYVAIYNAIKHVFTVNVPQTTIPFNFRGIPVEKLNRKTIYGCLAREVRPPLCVGLWRRKFGVTITSAHWNTVLNLREIRLRELSWKILHNVFPTNIMLHKIDIAPTNLCKYCNAVDYTEHFFFQCNSVKAVWVEIKHYIMNCFNKNVHMTEQVALFGITDLEGATRSEINQINQLIAIGRMTISKFRYGRSRNLLEIYESDCALRKVGRFRQ